MHIAFKIKDFKMIKLLHKYCASFYDIDIDKETPFAYLFHDEN